MNKKGFTLIELLAIIIIIAIIALITVPIVLSIIDKTKKQTFEQTVNGIIKSGELYHGEELLSNDNSETKIFDAPFNQLSYKGEKPDKGVIKIDPNGSITAIVCNTSLKICFKKEDNSELKEIDFNTSDDEINNIKNPPVPTNESCFCMEESTGTIHSYYNDTTGSFHQHCEKPSSAPTNCNSEVVIPSTINGIEVKYIGNYAFVGGPNINLTKVIIPDTVLAIMSDAFSYQPQLKNLKIGSNVTTIDDQAFAYSDLRKVIIPDSVITIGEIAFGYTQTGIGELILGKNVTTIGYQAFSNNSLKSLLITKSVTGIANNAFFANKLETVTINSPNITMGNNAFGWNYNLKTIYNNSGKAFEWNKIIYDDSGDTFEFGEIPFGNEIGKIIITKS